MSFSKKLEKKIVKKIKRCQLLIQKDAGTQFCDEVTTTLVVCNAGLSTGLEQEVLLKETLPYGIVRQVFFPPGKSYCFLQFASMESARTTHGALNGICPLGQGGTVLLLAFCREFPLRPDGLRNEKMPCGLILERDFIDGEMEKTLLEAIVCIDSERTGATEQDNFLKHRCVKHFGYEFKYGSNNVDMANPLDRKIPQVCDVLWERLRKMYPSMSWHFPDQLTVNQYKPGQGIPPHVDTHSAFEDPILSLSLGSDIVMEFKNPSTGRRFALEVPTRSLLIMSGESRYDWTHGITPRKMDTIPGNRGGLTVRRRMSRVSLTFRKLRQDDRCDCIFPKLCDTAQQAAENQKKLLDCYAAQVESENVHRVYNEIAKHFSDTRHSPWPRVKLFVQSVQSRSVLLDIGCGNGKYLSSDGPTVMFGCDRSDGLLNVCRDRGLEVLQCDCLAVPFRDGSVDACISIAVIHHLATDERRKRAISEMMRVLRPGGRALIYVWAKNQEANAIKSNYLRQSKQNHRPTPAVTAEDITVMEKVAGISDCALPVHTNRTQFKHKDLLVPWKLRPSESTTTKESTFLRYYHVFERNELEQMCLESSEGCLKLIESYYDQGNWCVIFERLDGTSS